MALIKEKVLPNGIAINYWKVYHTNIDWHNKKCQVVVGGFISQQVRADGFGYVDRYVFNWVDGDFPLSETGANTVTQIYQKLKESRMEFDEDSQELVEKNFFFDAVDDIL